MCSQPATSPAFPPPRLAADLRVEHEDHAKSHGRRVGANMAGAGEPYDHLPFFYSDLFDLGYEAVGVLDSRLEMLVELGEVGDQGIVYYLDRERRPRGVLLWNLFGRVDDARELIRAGDRSTRARAGRWRRVVPAKPASPLRRLSWLGQSVWIDYLSRDLLESGELARLVAEDSVVGVTSNPTIFQQALAHGDAYDEQLRELLSSELGRKDLFLELACARRRGRLRCVAARLGARRGRGRLRLDRGRPELRLRHLRPVRRRRSGCTVGSPARTCS